jgi:hypothetical protein
MMQPFKTMKTDIYRKNIMYQVSHEVKVQHATLPFFRMIIFFDEDQIKARKDA